MAPRDFFDENPYKNEKPLPPARRSAEKKFDLKPFKPSSPAKVVRHSTPSANRWHQYFIMFQNIGTIFIFLIKQVMLLIFYSHLIWRQLNSCLVMSSRRRQYGLQPVCLCVCMSVCLSVLCLPLCIGIVTRDTRDQDFHAWSRDANMRHKPNWWTDGLACRLQTWR